MAMTVKKQPSDRQHRYLKNVTTLTFDSEKCTGCGLCETVCPHSVFELNEGKLYLTNKDACIECGACALNCPTKALFVNPGTGCASAFIFGWLTDDEPACDCSGGGFC
ncbi:MAG: 4Fe-4S binding protein [Oscillospiraceae bacterium]|nr:4Fe-4S binding protein [Oscillospiraceae bacterium]